MLRPLAGILAIFLIVILSELLWRKRIIRGEWSRKLVHMSVGCFVAFWPFFTSFHWVQLLAIAFLAVIATSRWLHVFKGIHSVKRKSWGELFYPIGIGAAALLTTNKYIFAAAVLNLSLADGLAAVVGLRFGKKHQYHFGTLTKSYAGTLTFLVVSMAITWWTVHSLAGTEAVISPLVIIVIPVSVAAVENVAPCGSDNLFIPLTVIGLLKLVFF